MRTNRAWPAVAAVSVALVAGSSTLAGTNDEVQAPPPTTLPLVVQTRSIDVNGRTARILHVRTKDGKESVRARRGERVRLELVNLTPLPVTLHPHGVLLPNAQDGVPYVTQLPVPPGGRFLYDFTPTQEGSYFLHSHFGWEIQDQLVIPFIIEDAAPADGVGAARDAASNGAKGKAAAESAAPKDVVFVLTDFLFDSPPKVFERLRAPKTESGGGDAMGDHRDGGAAMKPDLVDVAYDAVLANGRTIKSMQIVRVSPSSTVRLRLINASSASNFRVDLGTLKGRAIEVDGEPIEPVEMSTVELGIAQRVDLLVDLPSDFQAQPIVAQAEGTTLHAAIDLAGRRSSGISVKPNADEPIGAIGVGYEQERKFRALNPLPKRPVDRTHVITLDGAMNGYRWSLNGMEWPKGPRLPVKEGERVELVFQNKTMMSHPMHLHGHRFQVTEIDGTPIDGAVRDTILVMPKSTVKVQFDADAPGLWMMHCHITWHEAAGMLGIVEYEGYPKPEWYLQKDTFNEPSSLPR
ncbi:MAG: multicopper oxidase family protein [Phycisphaerae bacterium]|nr:multicopper oxidase family protein [Phycisphaerae bacterium]